MATAAWVPLATTTLSGTSSSVTFGSISGYKDLSIVANLDNTAQTELYVRLNGDSGGNYNTVRMQSNGSLAASAATANATGARLNGNGDIMTDFTFVAHIQLLDVSSTSKHKHGVSRTNSSNGVDACAFRWANTSAVTSVTLYPNSGSFEAGSTLSIWGRNAL